MANDTIYALSSGAGRAAVAVIRLSGPNSLAAIDALTKKTLPQPRYASQRRLWSLDGSEQIDDSLIITFEQGVSFTGEQSAEIHTHGGRAVVNRVFQELEKFGLRIANAGEFTMRAFMNGKVDLSQAEAIAALVDAEVEAERKHSMRVLDGEVGRLAESWRSSLLRILALLEASIDFIDEDIGEDTVLHAVQEMCELLAEWAKHLSDNHLEDPYSPVTIAILGPPNSGKSTLINALSQRDLSIVSDIPGTTRDVIRATLEVSGRKIEVMDTAGLRESSDPIERIGVQRSKDLAEKSNLRAFLVSEDTFQQFNEYSALLQSNDLLLWTKSDRAGIASVESFPSSFRHALEVSETDGSARHAFISYIEREIAKVPEAASPISGSSRRKRLVSHAVEHINRSITHGLAGEVELSAEEVRYSAKHISSLTGALETEEILGEIFSSFCIGK